METVISVKETVTEYKDLLEPLMRQRALWLRGGTSVVSYSLGTIVRNVNLLVGGVAALYLLGILEPYLTGWLHSSLIGRWPHRIAVRLPAPPIPEGRALVLILLIFVYYQLSKVVKRLFTEEVRLPGSFLAS